MSGFRRDYTQEIIHDDYETVNRRRKNRRIMLTIITGVVAALLLVGWQQGQAQADSSIAKNSGLHDVMAGQLLIQSSADNRLQSASMLQSSVHFNISGMLSRAEMTQSFRNDTSEQVNGVYSFPVPDNASVNSLQINVGDRVIDGGIAESEGAKAIYQNARNNKPTTKSVESLENGVFSTMVSDIAPGETVVVKLKYLQTLAFESGKFTLRFPMTVSESVTPLISADQFNNEAVLSTPAHPYEIPDYNHQSSVLNPISISATIDMGMPIKQLDSISHNVVHSPESLLAQASYIGDNNSVDHRYTVQLKDYSVSMDRDFVLSWLPDIGEQPGAAVFSEKVDGEDYALVMVVPPLVASQAPLVKEVIYVIDTSRAAGEQSLTQARQVLTMALQQLHPGDRFNVIDFNTDTRWLFSDASEVNTSNIRKAIDFIASSQPHGDANVVAALNDALAERSSVSYLRQVVLVSASEVSNEDGLYKLVDQKLGENRLFTVALGSSPDLSVLRKVAQMGRGSLIHIRSIEQTNDKVALLLQQLEAPVAKSMALSWDGIGLEHYPENIPDLYRGEPMLISAKLTDISTQITVSGLIVNGETEQLWEKTLPIPTVSSHAGVGALWGHKKISNLLQQKMLGADATSIRSDVISVALQHQLLSPYTNFVAVDNESQQLLVKGEMKNNTLSDDAVNDNSRKPLAYASTPTGNMQAQIYGIAFLLMAVVFFQVLRRDEHTESLSVEK